MVGIVLGIGNIVVKKEMKFFFFGVCILMSEIDNKR